MFSKDTIMGQILFQVKTDKENKQYVDAITSLLVKIEDKEYLDNKTDTWSKNGLVITDRALSKVDMSSLDVNWTYVETPHISEYSWLVNELSAIFNPETTKNKYRLFTTIGFLLNLYTDRYNNLDDIFSMTARISTIWLHPDHIQHDRFAIHPANLPNFGNDF